MTAREALLRAIYAYASADPNLTSAVRLTLAISELESLGYAVRKVRNDDE